jgi:hypothetical protein
LNKQWSPKRVIIISKTYKSDPSIKPLIDLCKEKKKDFEKNNCFSEVKEGIDFLTKLVEVQKNMKEELKKSIS